MDISSIASLLPAQQIFTIEAANALMLRVGEEMTATILDIVDNHILLDVAGQRLSATLQADRQLSPGQVVRLVAVDVQPEQVTLRVVSDDMLTGPPGQQALASVGLPDTAENRVALVALLAEGQPITAEAVQTLRQVASSLGATTPEDVHAVAYLLARDLPLTAALLSVVREGQSAGKDLSGLEQQLRAQAGQLLQAASEELQAAAPELRGLLAQLASSTAQLSPGGAGIQALVQQLTVSLEATLRGLLEHEPSQSPSAASPGGGQAPEGAPVAADKTASGPPPAPQPGAPEAGAPVGTPPASAAPGKATAPDQAAEADAQQAGPGQPGGGTPQMAPSSQPAPSLQVPADSELVQQAEAAAVQVELEPPLPQPSATEPAGVPTPPSVPAGSSAPNAHPGASAPSGLPSSVHGPAPSAPPPTAHEITRRLIPALDRALQGAATPALATAATELRHTAERFVQAVQFQQLETLLQPTPAEPYVAFPLPIPQAQGEGELRLFVRDDERSGSPRLDPNDARLLLDLRLSQLKRVTIMVHVYQRQLYCHMQAESLQAQRLLESAAPELRDSLHGLGYAVDPIHCTMGALSRWDTKVSATLSLSKLGRLNVTA